MCYIFHESSFYTPRDFTAMHAVVAQRIPMYERSERKRISQEPQAD